MHTKHLLLASLAGGLISLVLVNAPLVNLINVLVCLGFWAGPLAAVWLHRRLAGTLTFGQAVLTGLLAGAWHGLFGLLLSPLGLAGAGGLLNALQPLVSGADWPGVQTGLSSVGALLFNLLGVLVDLVFGLVGGLLGGAFFGTRRAAA
jgi:hypothetical protein